MSTTTFIARIEMNATIITAIAQFYHSELRRRHDQCAQRAAGWRSQAAHLIEWWGRADFVDNLMDVVPGLSVRDAMMIADMAGRAPSESVPALRNG